ncbi:fumarylacetoacetate hydrolase family protein [Catellatospora vulcania]|uniref:fumarylacetoacetate hydrolase family protein n=1 Tax=Catellatospora vulcania TaxID=1460450 RepID=UPI0012D43805|nr:fumarylacetoacetate hydrolase family protein [Catellatospora vulcania]
MKLATFGHRGEVKAGVVVGELIQPLAGGLTVADVVAGHPADTAGPQIPVAEVRLLPPLQPPTVRDFVAFEEHVEGVVRSVGGTATVPQQWYAAPTFYFTNPYAMIGAHDDVAVPPGCQVLDFELEVAAVIGRPGADLTVEQARDHIFGYTIFNDWSARDLQRAEMQVQLGPAKGKDFATTLGPWLVTADELDPWRDPDGHLALGMSVAVNGRTVGVDLLSNMGWPFEALVAYASRGTQVRSGDVLGSGTCGNGGCLAELWGRSGTADPPPLRPGDVVSMTVDGIGTIANRVVAGRDPHPIPAARTPSRRRPAHHPTHPADQGA